MDEEKWCNLVGWFSSFLMPLKSKRTHFLTKPHNIKFGALTNMCYCAMPLRTLQDLLTEPRAKSDVFTQNLPQYAKVGGDLFQPTCINSHLSICSVSVLVFYHFRSLNPNLWDVRVLCVLQSCVWLTLPSHRTRVSLNSATESKSLGPPTFDFTTR